MPLNIYSQQLKENVEILRHLSVLQKDFLNEMAWCYDAQVKLFSAANQNEDVLDFAPTNSILEANYLRALKIYKTKSFVKKVKALQNICGCFTGCWKHQ